MKKKPWIISVNMGYGHQRTSFPFKKIANKGEIIIANDYPGIPDSDKKIWENSRKFYEAISKFKRIPLVGDFAFSLFDKFQSILSFYPKRDMSRPNFSLIQIIYLIEKGWGKHLIKKLGKRPVPMITTFFTPAFMAEKFGYPGEIYCVVCDADISRAWATIGANTSRIKYFVPTKRVAERLKLYGVRADNIFFSGYPLPLSNVGDEKKRIAKNDLACRLANLDPKGKYRYYYEPIIRKYIGRIPKKSNHPLTLMFAVGGAGAQKEIGLRALKSLKEKLKNEEMNFILVAGIKKNLKEFFISKAKEFGLGNKIGKSVKIIFEPKIEDYFTAFNKTLRVTDILWTKPSELSFYTALGLPIIIAPIIGSQEHFNEEWILELGSGIRQKNPVYIDQWLFDMLDRGWFAEAAMQGFIEGEKLGTLNIEQIISKK